MTTMELGELALDIQSAVKAQAGRRVGLADLGRRALNDGRVRALTITALAATAAALFEHSLRRAEMSALLSTVAWTLAVSLTDRRMQTARAVAGAVGVAACAAVGGAVLASASAFWFDTVIERPAELGTMTVLVFVTIAAVEIAKARVAVLRQRVLLVGGTQSALELVEMLARDVRTPFTLAGLVDDDSDRPVGDLDWLGPVSSLRSAVEEIAPDLVVVAAERGRPEIFAQLASVSQPRFRMVGLPEFYEHAFGRVPVRNVTDAWFMSVLHLYQRPYTRVAKRSFDIVAATLGLLVTAPLFPLIALLVRCTGGPVFYRQTRLGEAGRPFSILKFRTMHVNAEAGGAVWAQQQDPRITGIGKVLRRTRLDEIPQLVNVLRGEMAIVGPRPERPEFQELLEEEVPFWSRRGLLKPGITGWAQLRSGYAADACETEEKLAHDLWYLRHQSLIVDFLICLRTLPSLLLAAGR